MKKLSKASLSVFLTGLKGFSSPKVSLEQYMTEPDIAADLLWTAYMAGDIEGRVIADLGCGTGILGIGALVLGAKKVLFIDTDKAALEMAENNLKWAKSETSIEGSSAFIHKDIQEFNEKVDTALENPPFGVKEKHADKVFLTRAIQISSVVYTIHKSESKTFISALCKDLNAEVTGLWVVKMPLKRTMAFHKKRIQRIEVGIWRIDSTKVR